MTADELRAMSHADLIAAMRKRAEIRRSIETRKSVQEGKPDRVADMLEEAANRLEAALKGRGDLLREMEALYGDKPDPETIP